MKRNFLIKASENKRLIIFFTGWSTDWHILEDIIIPEGYDLLCIWDYRTWDWSPLNKIYEEIVIIAWSFGVVAAENLYHLIKIEGNVTGLYAINGSRIPVDDDYGIPVRIFDSTLKTLDERNLKKFKIRISGGIEKYNELKIKLETESNIDSLKQELFHFSRLSHPQTFSTHWDFAFISESDKIFPVENLKKSWWDTPVRILKNEEHLTDFQKIFNLAIKDKSSITKNFEKSLSTYEDNAESQKKAASRLIGLLNKDKLNFKEILEIGSGSGFLTKKIFSSFPDCSLTMIDLADNSMEGVNFLKGDAETLLKSFTEATFDLVISSSTFQWMHSPARVIRECGHILKKGGKCAFTTYIEGTFEELSKLSGNSLLYLSEEQWKLLVKKSGMSIEHSEVAHSTLLFDSVRELFHHLKATGVNALSGKNKTISEMKKMMDCYPGVTGKYPLTYVSLLMILNNG